jgi:hypothetical protein
MSLKVSKEKGLSTIHKLRHFDSDIPPSILLPNATVCEGYTKFIAKTLEERLTMVLYPY